MNKALETVKKVKLQRIQERCEELFKLIKDAKYVKIRAYMYVFSLRPECVESYNLP